jgi:hypothetical protein
MLHFQSGKQAGKEGGREKNGEREGGKKREGGRKEIASQVFTFERPSGKTHPKIPAVIS